MFQNPRYITRGIADELHPALYGTLWTFIDAMPTEIEKDYLQKISDAPIKTCPHCGQDTMKKELSAPGFELKGSGWAATDFNGGHKALPASHVKSEKK